MAPVHDLLKETQEWRWHTPQEDAFNKIKQALTSPQVLAHYDPTLPTVISSEASQTGIGAALYQIHSEGTRRPVSFASRSRTDIEKRYTVFEKESLAAVWACECFNEYIYRLHDLTLKVDHKPLVPLFTTTSLGNMPPRVLCFRLRLMKHSPTVTYVPGSRHQVPDALSHAATESTILDDTTLIKEVKTFNTSYLPKHNSLRYVMPKTLTQFAPK